MSSCSSENAVYENVMRTKNFAGAPDETFMRVRDTLGILSESGIKSGLSNFDTRV